MPLSVRSAGNLAAIEHADCYGKWRNPAMNTHLHSKLFLRRSNARPLYCMDSQSGTVLLKFQSFCDIIPPLPERKSVNYRKGGN